MSGRIQNAHAWMNVPITVIRQAHAVQMASMIMAFAFAQKNAPTAVKPMAHANVQINARPDVILMAHANAQMNAQMAAMMTGHVSKPKTA